MNGFPCVFLRQMKNGLCSLMLTNLWGASEIVARDSPPPANYTAPPFPSLHWPPSDWTLQTVGDAWRFTLTWTLIIFALSHLAAAGIALAMQVGKRRPSGWKYLWLVPLGYVVVAGVEALFAGSIVGAM